MKEENLVVMDLEDLKKCVEFAKKHGEGEFKIVSLTSRPCGGIGSIVKVKNRNGEEEDLTDVDRW